MSNHDDAPCSCCDCRRPHIPRQYLRDADELIGEHPEARWAAIRGQVGDAEAA